MDGLRDLAIWTVLEERGTDDQRQVVSNLVEYAAPLLDRIPETLPTYTLHTASTRTT